MRFVNFLLIGGILLSAEYARAQDGHVLARHRMVKDQIEARGISDARILAAMSKIERHRFIPFLYQGFAYADSPVPIDHGQTISQPFIVALMTDLLDVRPGDVVLEVGTGSGYQAAVLAELGAEVYSIEIVPELGRGAGRRLAELGYDDAHTRVGDGYYGWPGPGPFDGIMVTAAASHIPPPLIQQLKPGGRMVIPVGGAFFNQELMLVAKDEAGRITTRQLLPVRFVPLTREQA